MLDDSFNLSALRALPIFAPLSEAELDYLRPVLSVTSHGPGDVVIEEGTPGSELYVLVDGECRVERNRGRPDQRLVATLKPVEIFGEMALLTGNPRFASVVATTDCRLLTLTQAGFHEVLLTHPPICIALLQDAYRRIADLEGRGAREAHAGAADGRWPDAEYAGGRRP